ncbi:MAG: L,D-transpeptidase [Deltaproteobacteria bacterium]|nr:L,D-transpeptidase [Deltaproteobacteria bacterium]
MRRRRHLYALAAAALAFMIVAPARADVLIAIDKSAQRMTVTVDGYPLYIWPVSTGAPGYDTPSGAFKPFRMERDHFSREWDDAPMPHSIFFTQQGHAIHGSTHLKAIGTPASHGCVRLAPRNANILFALVKQERMSNTRVVLTGETPVTSGVPVARQDRGYQRADNTDDDQDFTGALPQGRQRSARGWREYSDDQRSYYYRERPYYPPPRRYYRYDAAPFLFGW